MLSQVLHGGLTAVRVAVASVAAKVVVTAPGPEPCGSLILKTPLGSWKTREKERGALRWSGAGGAWWAGVVVLVDGGHGSGGAGGNGKTDHPSSLLGPPSSSPPHCAATKTHNK